MNSSIPEESYNEIEDIIGSDESVVGIDAKKTHIIIIHMLKKIQEELDNLDGRLEVLENKIK